MSKKIALITGITGQDGVCLSKFLLENNYKVHGLIRSKSSYDHEIIKILGKDFFNSVFFHKVDLRNSGSVEAVIKKLKPDEVYNLGAISNPGLAEKRTVDAYDINFLGLLRILESIRKFSSKTKIFQAGSLLQFSLENSNNLNEYSKFDPKNVYGKTKQLAYELIKEYREEYNIFACCGFMSNHESILRDGRALNKMIVKNIAKLHFKKINFFNLYNTDYRRDWGHANDFVRAMWLMLQNDKPEDFIIAANNFKKIEDFCKEAFKNVGIDISWTRTNKYDYAKNNDTGKILIKSKKLPDRKELDYKVSTDKIRNRLNWSPKIEFNEVVREMINMEINFLKYEKVSKKINKGKI